MNYKIRNAMIAVVSGLWIAIFFCCVLHAQVKTVPGTGAPKEIAKTDPKAEPLPVIRAEVKVRLLVHQAKLRALDQAIEASPLGKQRVAENEKFNAEMQNARADCKGGDPNLSDDDVICQIPKKEEASAAVPSAAVPPPSLTKSQPVKP
jgi:hypothetical protein